MPECHHFLFSFLKKTNNNNNFFVCNNVNISSLPCLAIRILVGTGHSVCVCLVSLGLEGTSCVELVLGSGAKGAAFARLSGDCSVVCRTCLFQERLKQSTPSMEEDKGTEGGCGKDEKQVAVVLWSRRGGGGVVLGLGNRFKGHPGTYCCVCTWSPFLPC